MQPFSVTLAKFVKNSEFFCHKCHQIPSGIVTFCTILLFRDFFELWNPFCLIRSRIFPPPGRSFRSSGVLFPPPEKIGLQKTEESMGFGLQATPFFRLRTVGSHCRFLQFFAGIEATVMENFLLICGRVCATIFSSNQAIPQPIH